MHRASEPGWFPIGLMLDPAGRRHVWLRITPSIYSRSRTGETPAGLILALEVCSGREGDDSYARIELGEKLTAETMFKLVDALDYGHHQVEVERDCPTSAIGARETLRRWMSAAYRRADDLRAEGDVRNADMADERAKTFHDAILILEQKSRDNDIWCDAGECWMVPQDANRCRVRP